MNQTEKQLNDKRNNQDSHENTNKKERKKYPKMAILPYVRGLSEVIKKELEKFY